MTHDLPSTRLGHRSLSRIARLLLLLTLLLTASAPGLAQAPDIDPRLDATTYTISGQVTDDQGQPLAGVTIQAVPTIGAVVVNGPDGNPVSGAQVYRLPAGGTQYALAGTTGADGMIAFSTSAGIEHGLYLVVGDDVDFDGKTYSSLPFLVLQAVGLTMCIIFPELTLYLPRLAFGYL